MTSLDSATYVVPDHGFGEIHRLPIVDVSPEIFSDLLETTTSEAGYLSAELGPRTANQGFAVSVGDSLIGHLSTADSQAYGLFDWVLSVGLHPRVTAHLSMTDASGDEWPTLDLLLPAPHLCIPANNPPAQRWTMLHGDATATLTEFSQNLTAFPDSEEHYLVSLRTRGFLRRHTVDVYLNNTFLGSLPRESARKIASSVLDCTRTGRLAIAHGYFHYTADNQPALTIYAHDAANKHHAGLVLAAIAGGSAVMSAATAARAQAASAVPGGIAPSASAAGGSATSVAAASGFEVAAATGASGAVASNLLAAASIAVLAGGGTTIATHLLHEDETLTDSHPQSSAPGREKNQSGESSLPFEGGRPSPHVVASLPSAAPRPVGHPAAPATPSVSHSPRSVAPTAGVPASEYAAISRVESAAATALPTTESTYLTASTTTVRSATAPTSSPSSSSEPTPLAAPQTPRTSAKSTATTESTTSAEPIKRTTPDTSTTAESTPPSEPASKTTQAALPTTVVQPETQSSAPEPEPETTETTQAQPSLPTMVYTVPDESEVPAVPLEPAEPKEPEEREAPEPPKEPSEPTIPPHIIVVIGENKAACLVPLCE